MAAPDAIEADAPRQHRGQLLTAANWSRQSLSEAFARETAERAERKAAAEAYEAKQAKQRASKGKHAAERWATATCTPLTKRPHARLSHSDAPCTRASHTDHSGPLGP